MGRGNYGTGVHNLCLEKRNEGNNVGKQENGTFLKEINGKCVYKTVAGGRCIISSMWLFLCGPSRACTTQEVVDPAVCMPGGCDIAFVSKNSYLWLLKGSVWKRSEKHSGFLPVGQWEKVCEGKGEGLSQQPGFHTELTRVYSLFMSFSPPRNIPVNYSLIIFALWPP